MEPPDDERAAAPPIAGRYRLEERLGWGGSAEVWSGTDRVLNRRVAVKRLLPHLVDDGPSRDRFRIESLALARVNHPGIVAVYDTILNDRCCAIVMELVEGGTLRERLDGDGMLDIDDVVQLGIQLFDALSAAHAHGLIHGDVSPRNLLFGAEGTVRLVDFGLASRPEPSETTRKIEMGTAAYVSPEHVSGEPIDSRSDIYSACAVLFEAACGRPPFVCSTEAATLLARLDGAVPNPTLYRPALPADLAGVIRTGLSRDPAQRFARASEASAALRAVAVTLHQPSPSLATGALIAGARRRSEGADTAGRGVSTLVTVDRSQLVPRTTPPSPSRSPIDASTSSTGTTTTSDRSSGNPVRRPRSSSNRLVAAMTALLVGGAALLVAALVTPDDLPDPPTSTVPLVAAEPLSVTGVRAFDPQGTGAPGENDEQLPALTDGDLATSWVTERYRDPRFGTKAGVGVVFDLGRDTALVEVELVSNTTDWRGEISVMSGNPTTAAPPGRVVEGTAGPIRVDLRGMRGSTVVLWITQLGPGPGEHVVELAEVAFVGRP